MRRAIIVGVCLAILAAVGCGEARQLSAAADPGVASWRTWVLPSADAVHVPPPPEDGGAASGMPRHSGSPTVAPLGGQWLELAMEYVTARTKNPPAASRAYALVSVAAFDALVAARHWQDVYAGERTPYPSETAAVAGAASRVLAHLFPEQPALRIDQLAEEATASVAATGAASTAAASAGLALGREVGAKVIDYARNDGADRAWDGGRPPHEARYWDPPPGSVSPPVEPTAGLWRPWVLSSGDALRPPPPPQYGSPTFMVEALDLVALGRDLTDEQREIARYWEGAEGTPLPPGIWNGIVLAHLRAREVSGPECIRTLAMVNVAMADAGTAAWDAKYAYWSPRPENAIRHLIDPAWSPLLRTPLFPAYVSGHSTYSGAAATVLAHLFPDDAPHFRALAEEAGLSRLYGGIHYWSDHVQGSRMGRVIGELVIERAHGAPSGISGPQPGFPTAGAR